MYKCRYNYKYKPLPRHAQDAFREYKYMYNCKYNYKYLSPIRYVRDAFHVYKYMYTCNYKYTSSSLRLSERRMPSATPPLRKT